ncbi:hypothetical protein F993_01539 [Acinetobacter proteolyticus]|uniref:Uncharacterized protein n=1 Tax=Acinetobacter proteolyticus TaxID=1776741 RepID=A0ABN0JGK1_9GAMM|nr:hypothetical protein [Acinetobacter proteolyticus]ENU24223.1 hypothetical protein F993_01539 [Acinetobacter proteolyticus]
MDNQELLRLFYEKLSSFTPDELQNRLKKAESELETLGFFNDFSDDIVEYYSSNNLSVFIKLFDDNKHQFESRHNISSNKLFRDSHYLSILEIKPDYQTLINHYIHDIFNVSIKHEWEAIHSLVKESHSKKRSSHRDALDFDFGYGWLPDLNNQCSYEKVGMVVNL